MLDSKEYEKAVEIWKKPYKKTPLKIKIQWFLDDIKFIITYISTVVIITSLIAWVLSKIIY